LSDRIRLGLERPIYVPRRAFTVWRPPHHASLGEAARIAAGADSPTPATWILPLRRGLAPLVPGALEPTAHPRRGGAHLRGGVLRLRVSAWTAPTVADALHRAARSLELAVFDHDTGTLSQPILASSATGIARALDDLRGGAAARIQIGDGDADFLRASLEHVAGEPRLVLETGGGPRAEPLLRRGWSPVARAEAGYRLDLPWTLRPHREAAARHVSAALLDAFSRAPSAPLDCTSRASG